MEESFTDLVHEQIAFTYLLQPITTIPSFCKGPKKNCLPNLKQGRIATKRKQKKQKLDWHGEMFSYLL